MKLNDPVHIGTSFLDLLQRAGDAIMEVYGTNFTAEQKADKSPLTLADKRSHEIISSHLQSTYPFPILSEEGKQIPYEERRSWKNFWLVDPLDGTKEFINRNGEFTINIAFLHDNIPVIGIIYVPVRKILYYALKGAGAYRTENGVTVSLPIQTDRKTLTVVGSRSHPSPEFEEYIRTVRSQYGEVAFRTTGSAHKFCLLAKGAVDIYPRFGPTMEWDIAAGQVLVEETGGKMVGVDGITPLSYNKQNLLNPYFLAYSGVWLARSGHGKQK